MSLYIHGCLFSDRDEMDCAQVVELLATPGIAIRADLDADDLHTVRALLEHCGLTPRSSCFFAITTIGESDATGLWLDANQSNQQSDGGGKAPLARLLDNVQAVETARLGLALAAFDGSIDGVRELAFGDGIAYFRAQLSKSWDQLSNDLVVMPPTSRKGTHA